MILDLNSLEKSPDPLTYLVTTWNQEMLAHLRICNDLWWPTWTPWKSPRLSSCINLRSSITCRQLFVNLEILKLAWILNTSPAETFLWYQDLKKIEYIAFYLASYMKCSTKSLIVLKIWKELKISLLSFFMLTILKNLNTRLNLTTGTAGPSQGLAWHQREPGVQSFCLGPEKNLMFALRKYLFEKWSPGLRILNISQTWQGIKVCL